MADDRGAGSLRQRVAFDCRVGIDDGRGNSEGAFVQQFTCSAGFTFLRGTEAVMAARLEGRQPLVVRVRASSDSRRIAADWQMRDTRTEVVYAVRSVIPTDDRAFIDVTCESGVAA